jgi:hypothetical protein
VEIANSERIAVIGHLERCAGVAGVFKVLLALKHQTIPPNMYFELSGKGEPRVSEASILQPLCTALQVVLVSIFAAAGVKLDAVVGHPYTAGIITRWAAMQVARYRGLSGAQADNGEGCWLLYDRWKRASAFVASSLRYDDRLAMASDVDAVAEAKEQLDSDQIFARRLVTGPHAALEGSRNRCTRLFMMLRRATRRFCNCNVNNVAAYQSAIGLIWFNALPKVMKKSFSA